MSISDGHEDYGYADAKPTWDDSQLWRVVERELRRVAESNATVFELGCGNGVTAARMRGLGLRVTAVDPSASGIEAARTAYAGIAFHVAAAEDDLADRFGHYPIVVSLEVVEHCYSPLRFASCAFTLLEPGGHLILSTPYHGYLKNLALSASGRMDAHFTSLWEGGHIKFFSVKTIRALLETAGFADLRVQRVGRIAPLAKSMVVTARRP